MVLDKKGILAEAKGQSVEVPFGKGSVVCSELSFNEMNMVRESKLINNDKGEFDGYRFVGLLTTCSIRDAKGNRVFEDNEIETVMSFPKSQYERLAETAKKLNGMADDEVKNFEADQSDSFSSSTA